MALPVHNQPIGAILPDGDGYGPYALGGQVNVKSASFLFSDATKDLFSLPAGAEIVKWEVAVETAFNAGTTNFLDVGDGTNQALFAEDIVLGAVGFVANGFKPAQMFSPLAVDTTFRSTYTQSGTVANAGKATVTVFWILR
ncbi:MAG: hypothetical protein K8I30_20350 [Anaerolineae bacterium]|nr:hypothetical protein [Anaerolineae bacterium]